jgi:two-component system LytT family response regulator
MVLALLVGLFCYIFGGTLKYTALIVDDEPLARGKLRSFLASSSDVEVIGEFGSGLDALQFMQQTMPDILFLDVQMPEMTGFELLENLEGKPPVVIFVTAYDQYAVQAFEVHAADYLLKPFDRERFEKALTRAKELVPQRNTDDSMTQKLLTLLEDLRGKAEPKHTDRIITKTNGRIRILRAQDIDWIEAEGNYVRLHTGTESHLLRETMNGLEQKLDPKKFVRIHRSTMINIEQVKELQPWFRGDYVVILKNAKQLTLSRGYRERLETLLGKSL